MLTPKIKTTYHMPPAKTKVPFELRDIEKTHAHLFEDGFERYHPMSNVEVIEAVYDGDVNGWVFNCSGFVGCYNSTGPVYRGGCADNPITEDELVTTLHLQMDFGGPEVGQFTLADIQQALGPDADQNGEVTRQWAVERLLKVVERRRTE